MKFTCEGSEKLVVDRAKILLNYFRRSYVAGPISTEKWVQRFTLIKQMEKVYKEYFYSLRLKTASKL